MSVLLGSRRRSDSCRVVWGVVFVGVLNRRRSRFLTPDPICVEPWARIPQAAEVYKLSKPAFEALMREIPEFSACLLNVMSGRLEDRLRKQRVAARYQQLAGDLKYFDLAAVIQALAGSGRSGTLTIRNSSGNH